MRKILPDGCASTRQNLPACRSIRPTSFSGYFIVCKSPALALGLSARPGLNFTDLLHRGGFHWRRELGLQFGDCGGTLRCNTQPFPIPVQFCD